MKLNFCIMAIISLSLIINYVSSKNFHLNEPPDDDATTSDTDSDGDSDGVSDNDSIRGSKETTVSYSDSDSDGSESQKGSSDNFKVESISKTELYKRTSSDYLKQTGKILIEAGTGATKSIITSSGSTKSAISLIQAFASTYQNTKLFLHGTIREIGVNVKNNVEIFVSHFEQLLKIEFPPEVFKELFDCMNLNLEFPAISRSLGEALGQVKNLEYFGLVVKALGEYYGWAMMHFYMNGSYLPSSWDDSQAALARLLIGINLGDEDEILDLGRLVDEFKDKSGESLLIACGIALDESHDALITNPDMLEILNALMQSNVMKMLIDDKFRARLVERHVDFMAGKSRPGLGNAIRNVIEYNDKVLTGAILNHLAKNSVNFPENTITFVNSLLRKDVPANVLVTYLNQLPELPKEISKLEPVIARRLSRLDDTSHFLIVLNTIINKSNMGPMDMLRIVENSTLRPCEKALASLIVSITSQQPSFIQKSLETIDRATPTKCSIKLVTDGLESLFLILKNVMRQKTVIDAILNSKLMRRNDVKKFIQENKLNLPNLALTIPVSKETATKTSHWRVNRSFKSK